MKTEGRRSRKSLLIVPNYVRDRLHPYAAIFEKVVLPFAETVTREDLIAFRTQASLSDKLRKYQMEANGREEHPLLLYYGLLLCCRYCGAEISWKTRKKWSAYDVRALTVLAKAEACIRACLQWSIYRDETILCG